MHPSVQVAEALKEALNTAELSRPVVASRAYLPVIERDKLKGVVVAVVPGGVKSEPASRGYDYYDCSIEIGIHAPMTRGDVEEADGLTGFSQEIIEYLRHKRFEGMSWLETKNDPVFDGDEMKKNLFASLVTVQYRVLR